MAATIVIGAMMLTSCSSTEEREESFVFSGQRLDVVNSHANMPVTVSSEAGAKEVVVKVQTETMGKSASTPAWSLSGSSLNLDTPCGDGVIGYCEGSYSIVVPEGTEVYINGVPTSTG
ncbi:hypothetical protein [Prescottella agglutinans]|uniref:hypothetical protein n=1 Tax=Prescottella agglutinans TaxID=1644129 RepID=UPI003D977862